MEDDEERDKNVATIHRLLNQADNEDLRLKADLIRKFLDTVVPALEKDSNVDEAYNAFEEEEREGEINDFAQDRTFNPRSWMNFWRNTNTAAVWTGNGYPTKSAEGSSKA